MNIPNSLSFVSQEKELSEKESNVMLLVGNAGVGKSVIIKKVIQRLESDDIHLNGVTNHKSCTQLRLIFA